MLVEKTEKGFWIRSLVPVNGHKSFMVRYRESRIFGEMTDVFYSDKEKRLRNYWRSISGKVAPEKVLDKIEWAN